MTSTAEKGGGGAEGIKLLLCENPLPPIEEAVAAAQAEVPYSPDLGPGFMRVTTALPEDNQRVVAALRELL
jgi:histidinol-phosphate/aromatic aminotransferase/cobyric acid decarboxylase-like protein